MLLNKFFYIKNIEGTETDFKVRVSFDAAHDIFKGHFPDMPVVPGVCQVQMIKETLSKLLNQDLFISTASSVKFLSVIEPMKTPELSMNIKVEKIDDEKFTVSADLTNEAEVFFRFKGELSAG